MHKVRFASIAFAGMLFSALPALAQAVTFVRLAGETRFETAIAVSQQMYPLPNQAPGAFLARSDDPADAVAVAPLAKLEGDQPVLITPKGALHPGTKAELIRLIKPGGTITIAGGTEAVSTSVAAELAGLGFTLVRLGGENRSDTAATIANIVHDIKPVKQVFIADMHQWKEGLYWSPIAAHHDGVVLLADGDTNAPETAAWMQRNPSVSRVAGFVHKKANPALTDAIEMDDFNKASVAQAFKEFDKPEEVAIATSHAFADALTAAAYMASIDGPILFADEQLTTKPLPSGLDAAIHTSKPSMVRVFGGPKAVSPQAVTAITDPDWKPGKQQYARIRMSTPDGQKRLAGVARVATTAVCTNRSAS